MADSASFSIDMIAKMTGADSAAAQISVLEDKLTAAGTAARAAADAVAEGQASYNQAEQAANRLAIEQEKLGQKALDLASAMQAAMNAGDASKFWQLAGAANALEAKTAGVAEKAAAAQAALLAEGAALDALRAKAGAAQKSQEGVGKALEFAKKTAADPGALSSGLGKVDDLGTALKKLPGPLGNVADGFGDSAEMAKKLLTQLGPVGAAAVAAGIAFAALVLGVAAATAAGLKFGIEMADAKRGVNDVLKLSNQTKRFQKLLQDTFGGLKTDKLMQGLAGIINLFDSSTSSGKALKSLFESIFQPIVDFFANHGADFERFFLGIEIGAMKVAIAVKPLVRGFFEFFGSLGLGSADLKEVGKWFFYVAAAGAALVAVVGGVLLFALVTLGSLLMAPVVAVMALWGALLAFVGWLRSAWNDPMGALLSFANFWNGLGSSLVDGFIAGITGGISRVVSAVTGLGSAAMGALKGALGIASPSKVFAEFGGHTAEGFAQGVEGGTGRAGGALESMVAMPDQPGGGGGRGGVTVTIENMNVSGANAREIAADFVGQLTSILEGDALSLGGAPA